MGEKLTELRGVKKKELSKKLQCSEKSTVVILCGLVNCRLSGPTYTTSPDED
jgi:hypothetical protein